MLIIIIIFTLLNSKTGEGELLVPNEISNKENDSVIMKDDPELRRKDICHEKTDFQYYMLSSEENDDTLYERKEKFQRSKKEKCGCCDYITRTSLFELCRYGKSLLWWFSYIFIENLRGSPAIRKYENPLTL